MALKNQLLILKDRLQDFCDELYNAHSYARGFPADPLPLGSCMIATCQDHHVSQQKPVKSKTITC